VKCADVAQHLEDYLDRVLPLPEADALERHVALCEQCRAALDGERVFRDLLRVHPVPAPSPGFFRRMLADARQVQGDRVRRSFGLGFASAAALAVLAWLVVTPITHDKADKAPEPRLPEVRLSVGEVKPVHLVFHVPRDIARSTMALELPEHVELRGYPGRRSLTWQTALHSGANDLALPILGKKPASGELRVRISYGEREQDFRVRLSVGPSASTITPAPSKEIAGV
jgi:hypothetical protein